MWASTSDAINLATLDAGWWQKEHVDSGIAISHNAERSLLLAPGPATPICKQSADRASRAERGLGTSASGHIIPESLHSVPLDNYHGISLHSEEGLVSVRP